MDEMKLILMVGLPRSGKSTVAKTLSKRLGAPIVCPDAIRLALHGQRYYDPAEPMVWAHAKLMVRTLFLTGHPTVILDATNIRRVLRDHWREYSPSFVPVLTPSAVCKERALSTGQPDLIPVIDRMAAEYEPVDPSEGPIFTFDL